MFIVCVYRYTSFSCFYQIYRDPLSRLSTFRPLRTGAPTHAILLQKYPSTMVYVSQKCQFFFDNILKKTTPRIVAKPSRAGHQRNRDGRHHATLRSTRRRIPHTPHTSAFPHALPAAISIIQRRRHCAARARGTPRRPCRRARRPAKPPTCAASRQPR